jgi:aryl-alcohol dehydrogenase-like predicted oxidoreductase
MRTKTFGTTGVPVSEMCLGTMMFGERCDEAEAARILAAALDQGVTFVDTAAMYANGRTEEILGRIMGARREQIFLATKVHKGVDGASIRESVDESLARLRTDYVDLYLIHWPREGMRPAEIMAALNEVVVQGKARFVGCCNYPAWLVAHSNAIAEREGWAKLVCNQVPYNLIERGIEVEILPQAAAERIAITVYRPLLIGLLAGKYRPGEPLPADSRGQSDERIGRWLEKHGSGFRAFNQLAADLGLHPAQLAIAWTRYAGATIFPIVGVSALGQLQATIDAFNFDLTPDQYQAITAMFDTAMKEEAGGRFPELRRVVGLAAPDLAASDPGG